MPDFLGTDGLARVAVISYNLEGSSLNSAFNAQEMFTVSLFDASGVPQEQVGLKHPVELKFAKLQQHEIGLLNYTCAFYDMELLLWSSQGCSLDNQARGRPNCINLMYLSCLLGPWAYF